MNIGTYGNSPPLSYLLVPGTQLSHFYHPRSGASGRFYPMLLSDNLLVFFWYFFHYSPLSGSKVSAIRMFGFVTPRRTHIGAHAQIAQKSINCQVKNIFVSSAAQYLRPAVAAHVDSRWRHEHKTVQHHSKPYWTTSCDPRDSSDETPFPPSGTGRKFECLGAHERESGNAGGLESGCEWKGQSQPPSPSEDDEPLGLWRDQGWFETVYLGR